MYIYYKNKYCVFIQSQSSIAIQKQLKNKSLSHTLVRADMLLHHHEHTV